MTRMLKGALLVIAVAAYSSSETEEKPIPELVYQVLDYDAPPTDEDLMSTLPWCRLASVVELPSGTWRGYFLCIPNRFPLQEEARRPS